MQALAHTYYVNVHTPSPTYPTLAKTHSGTDQPTDRYPHKNMSPHTIIAAYIIYTQTHIHTSRTCAHAHIHTNMHTSIHSYIHTHTYLTDMHPHTYIHQQTPICIHMPHIHICMLRIQPTCTHMYTSIRHNINIRIDINTNMNTSMNINLFPTSLSQPSLSLCLSLSLSLACSLAQSRRTSPSAYLPLLFPTCPACQFADLSVCRMCPSKF